jgi:hypothetical protein
VLLVLELLLDEWLLDSWDTSSLVSMPAASGSTSSGSSKRKREEEGAPTEEKHNKQPSVNLVHQQHVLLHGDHEPRVMQISSPTVFGRYGQCVRTRLGCGFKRQQNSSHLFRL